MIRKEVYMSDSKDNIRLLIEWFDDHIVERDTLSVAELDDGKFIIKTTGIFMAEMAEHFAIASERVTIDGEVRFKDVRKIPKVNIIRIEFFEIDSHDLVRDAQWRHEYRMKKINNILKARNEALPDQPPKGEA
jgi:hypothetical protein